ncbi:MAG: periplasmic heavy metal sensor [Nitrospira sp. LK70]|nr:periplasmic heavy metal sensor [Nitrospira sp. LK70]
MKSVIKATSASAVVSVCLLMLGVPSLWANDPSYGYGYAGGGHSAWGGHGYGKGMMHSGTGHLIRHLLKHEKDIGLTTDQIAKLKDIQLNLDKARIKVEADIQIAERELRALTDEEKSDLAAIETKLKQSEDLQVALRMTSIKTRREVMSLLTPEQRAKEHSEHEKVMQQHKGYGTPHGGAPTYGGYPHGGNPHGGYPYGKNPHEGVSPTPPSGTSVQ